MISISKLDLLNMKGFLDSAAESLADVRRSVNECAIHSATMDRAKAGAKSANEYLLRLSGYIAMLEGQEHKEEAREARIAHAEVEGDIYCKD